MKTKPGIQSANLAFPGASPLTAEVQLSRLLDEVERGETVVITRQGRPVARLVPEQAGPKTSVDDTIAAIRALRKRMPRVKREEILALRHEGHRY